MYFDIKYERSSSHIVYTCRSTRIYVHTKHVYYSMLQLLHIYHGIPQLALAYLTEWADIQHSAYNSVYGSQRNPAQPYKFMIYVRV